jgi:alanine racemase
VIGVTPRVPCPPGRPAWAEVDLDAVAHNVAQLRRAVAPAAVWSVVKADGYGHGAVAVSRAALGAGAAALAVALVEEAVALRRAGVDAPLLVLSEAPPHQHDDVVRWELRPVVYSPTGIDALAARAGPGRSVRVHLKVDTGMHRVGARPADAVALAEQVVDAPGLELEGVMTHLAVADEPDDPYTDQQLDAFDDVLRGLRAAGIDPPLVHAANSAGGLAHPRARYSLVRAGIATYGIAPGPGVRAHAAGLQSVLTLRARVSFVKRVAAGARISYGLRHQFERDATVATVPLGYADGVPRRLSSVGGEVLIGGRRRPITGVVTMDQLMVDCGDDAVAVGDEVVLLGVQGDERVTADEWAERLGTIAYEITCGIGARVPRVHVGGPDQAGR